MFTFIGATTENPSFEVNSALLSRAAVYVLKSLSEDDLSQLVERALALDGDISIDDEGQQMLVASADGDGRKLLNNTEIVLRAAAQALLVRIARFLPPGGRLIVAEPLLILFVVFNLRAAHPVFPLDPPPKVGQEELELVDVGLAPGRHLVKPKDAPFMKKSF